MAEGRVTAGDDGSLDQPLMSLDGATRAERSPSASESASGGADLISNEIARVVAFYLPQYHQIPENDEWWGEGFTDWTNVKRAQPQFDGHVQPRVPSTLGYYDLRNIEVHHAQAALAKSFGVGAFCYYAYWFAGRRLLERPLDLVLRNPDIAMPYAICWANEPWSRRWDGSEHEVLMGQHHSPEGDPALIEDLGPHLSDPRYLRIAGRPLLLIYRSGLLVDPLRTTDALRERAVALGLGDLYLAIVQSFGHWEPIGYGFDAAVEFPPHNVGVDARLAKLGAPLVPAGTAIDARSYEDVIRVSLSRPVPDFPWFRGVMPAWDNTPRRKGRGTVYVGDSPHLFGRWLEEALRFTYLFREDDERIVFINGWNEWAEGAYLEPDQVLGDARLQAVRDAISRTSQFALDTARLQASGMNPNDVLDRLRQPWTHRDSSASTDWPVR